MGNIDYKLEQLKSEVGTFSTWTLTSLAVLLAFGMAWLNYTKGTLLNQDSILGFWIISLCLILIFLVSGFLNFQSHKKMEKYLNKKIKQG